MVLFMGDFQTSDRPKLNDAVIVACGAGSNRLALKSQHRAATGRCPKAVAGHPAEDVSSLITQTWQMPRRRASSVSDQDHNAESWSATTFSESTGEEKKIYFKRLKSSDSPKVLMNHLRYSAIKYQHHQQPSYNYYDYHLSQQKENINILSTCGVYPKALRHKPQLSSTYGDQCMVHLLN